MPAPRTAEAGHYGKEIRSDAHVAVEPRDGGGVQISMFGTDSGMDEEMYRNIFRWLETSDDYFEPWGYPGQGRWLIYGIKLPDDVLEKIYHKNAENLFAQFKGQAK